MKTIKLSQYFKIIHPTYIILKLIPDTSIRNYNSSNIANTINSLYKDIKKRIRKDKKTWNIEAPLKCSFYIDIMKNKVDFYFIVPDAYHSLFKEKITETWPKITIETVDAIPNFSKDSLKYYLYYKYEDALSLKLDKKCNEPLNSILNTLNIINADDRVGILYNFMPTSQKNWIKRYKRTIQRIKKGECISNEIISPTYIIKLILTTTLEILQGFAEGFEELFNTKKENKSNLIENILSSLLINDKKEISKSTQKKKDANIINTQIVIQSDSSDINRKYNNALAVTEAFQSIKEDNELVYKKLKSDVKYTNFKISNVAINKTSIEECQNFLQLPGRDLLDQHKCISKIDVLETQVPKQLQTGTKLIGISEYKGSKQNAYLTTDKDYKNLAVTIVGPTRSGKTSFMGNLARDSVDSGECVIVLDYIENCQLSEDIKRCIPKDKTLEINLYDHTKIEGLGYNEAIIKSDDTFIKYESAKKQTSQLITLVNSINIANSDFTPKMERYLTAASLVAFINNGAIKDVFKILQDHNYRKQSIDSIPNNEIENLEEYVDYLKELDEWSKGSKDNPPEVIGTHSSYITGIIDRIQKLKSNTYMELMLKKDCSNNINLLEEMEKNQVIFIKMPENMFSTPDERDIMTTYWLTKIWMCAQARAWKIKNRYDRKTVNVFTDEIAQLKNSEQFIGNKLDQTAKFGVKFILSTMYINQLRIREKLRTANTSYILISGSDKINYLELKEELQEFGFQLEDLMHLKRFYSLNYVKYEEGYTAFISKLPQPVNIKGAN